VLVTVSDEINIVTIPSTVLLADADTDHDADVDAIVTSPCSNAVGVFELFLVVFLFSLLSGFVS
jgi:hypothetical protein